MHEAVDTVFHLVLIGIPLLVLITGIVTYLAAGRALRPVEAIRARVATTRGTGRSACRCPRRATRSAGWPRP